MLPPDRDVVDPLHIVAGVAVEEITGFGFTVTVRVADPVHPEAVPLTVYIVVEPGVTETGVPAKLPGIQLKVVPAMPLLAVKEDVAPLQITAGVAEVVKTRFGLTVTVTEAVPVQPLAVPVTV